MLEPQQRAAFTEQLQPPAGFRLVQAVGTTFTLDLVSALTVPLSFSSSRLSDADYSVAIFAAISQAADAIDIFGQAGEITLRHQNGLIAYLEPSIHAVAKPRGLFHPKVWLLEFARGDERRWRLVSSSRNLTGDRSWDIVVRLDGEPRPSGRNRQQNAPLQRLVRGLPALCVQPLDAAREQRIRDFADRLGAVEWEEDALRDLTFHTLGIGRPKLPDITGIRGLVISPFVTDDRLAELRAGIRGATHLLSRETTLDRLAPASFDAKLASYVLDPAAELETAAEHQLTGLHAKAIIVDQTYRSRVWLGSANATRAAWRDNVEFLIEFEGPTGEYGVEATLKALGELKVEYETAGGASEPADEAARHTVDAALRRLAAVPVTSRVVDGEPFAQRVWGTPELADALVAARARGVEISWRLLTQRDVAVPVIGTSEADAARFDRLELTEVTAFLVAVATHPELPGERAETIIPMRLLDDRADRKEAIIAGHLTDPAAFVRLLTLLLQLSGMALGSGAGVGGDWSAFGGAGGSTTGLFESLVRALAQGSGGIEDAHRIIDYLRRDPGTSILPEGFDALWDAVWAAHLELRPALRQAQGPAGVSDDAER